MAHKQAVARAMLNALARWRDTNATRIVFAYSHEREVNSLERLARSAAGEARVKRG